MNRQIIEPDVTLRVAYEDPDSVVKLIGELVRIPSRAGTDPCGPMLERMSTWLAGHGMVPRRLPAPGGETVTMVCEIHMMAALRRIVSIGDVMKIRMGELETERTPLTDYITGPSNAPAPPAGWLRRARRHGRSW